MRLPFLPGDVLVFDYSLQQDYNAYQTKEECKTDSCYQSDSNRELQVAIHLLSPEEAEESVQREQADAFIEELVSLPRRFFIGSEIDLSASEAKIQDQGNYQLKDSLVKKSHDDDCQ